MIRVVVKCPYCGKKPWIRPCQHHGFIMGCCRMYCRFLTETETRSSWNEMAAAKHKALKAQSDER